VSTESNCGEKIMNETINVNRPVNNSFYDAIVQDIVEWEKENAQKEEEDKNDAT